MPTARPHWPAPVRVAAAIALFFVCLFGTALLSIPVASLLPATNEAQALLRIGQQLFFCVLLIVALSILVRRVDRQPLAFTGFRWSRWSLPLFIIGVGASAILMVPAVAIALSLGHPLTPMTPEPVPLVLVVILAISQALFLQSLPEELVYRGYVLNTLRDRPGIAIATSIGVFTAIHLVSSGGQQNLTERFIYLAMPLGFSLSAVGLGLLLRSLWVAVGIHAGFHWASMIAFAQGVGNGPMLWICIGAVHTLVGVVALLLWWRRSGSITYDR